MTAERGPIRLHPENPRYFLYRGKPLVLITATEHYGAVINRNFGYLTYLDDMAGKRQTLSRCFLLFRELSTFNPSSGNDNPLFGTPEAVRPVNPHSPCKPLEQTPRSERENPRRYDLGDRLQAATLKHRHTRETQPERSKDALCRGRSSPLLRRQGF